MGARSYRACRRLKRATVSLASALLATGFLAGFDSARGDDPSQVSPAVATAPAENDDLTERLKGLVADLGADEYFVREKAQRELQRLGIVAFDVVYEATDHEDIEVAHRAKYLVATIEIDWVEEGDSDAVKTILSRYEDSPTDEREKSVLRLSELPVGEALEPLSRIARFEPSESLSRLAVLQLMDLTSAKEFDEAKRIAMAKRLALLSGSGKRPSSKWLAAHAATLQNPAESVDVWDTLIQEDLDLYHHRPELTNPNVVAQLLKRHGELLLSLDRKEDAYASLRRLFQVIPSEESTVLANVRWLVDRKAWPVVLDAETRYAAMFQQELGLAYCAAEAHAAMGDDEGVRRLLERIENDASIEPGQRIQIAEDLQTWGRFDWSEREYRLGLKDLKAPNPMFGWASRSFAEMLHDRGEDAEAAAILADYLKALDEDEQFRSILVDQFEYAVAEHRARQATFRGLALQAEGKLAESREAFEKGFADYEFDADLLIAMHRAPEAPPEWRETTKKRIETALGHFKAEIAASRQEVEISGRAGNAKAARTSLALNCNQYAWLVGNTFGDFDDAVRRSEESLAISPDSPGYLDTLARTLFARGDVAEAIRTQRKALEFDPHSGALNRQLREFEAAAAASQAAP